MISRRFTGPVASLTTPSLQLQRSPARHATPPSASRARRPTPAAVPKVELGTTAGTACEGNDSRLPTQDENDALVGTGTPSVVAVVLRILTFASVPLTGKVPAGRLVSVSI